MQKLLISCLILIHAIAMGQETNTYQLKIEQSTIDWRGTYAFQFSEHSGTVKFKEGTLNTTGNDISGGSFIIDMTTISNEEYLDGVGPVEHLRNQDFFDVTKHPEAKLDINSVEYFRNENRHKFLADFTIKGITKQIEFWADVDGSKKTLKTKFKIDRTRWGITHNNKLKNHSIADAVEFYVTLQF